MKRLKALLLICLMLAIPLQAMAGKLTLCESLHASVPHALHHDGEHHPQMTGSQVHGMHILHMHMMQMDHTASAEGAYSASLSSDSPSNTQLGSCSICASCAASAFGMTVKEYRLPDSAAPSTPISYFAFHIPAVDLEHPDDPPRV